MNLGPTNRLVPSALDVLLGRPCRSKAWLASFLLSEMSQMGRPQKRVYDDKHHVGGFSGAGEISSNHHLRFIFDCYKTHGHSILLRRFDVKRVSMVIAAIVLVLSLAIPLAAQEQTIVEIATNNDDFATLVAAVAAADLVETLSGDGPFTVFAPTNDAFARSLNELGLTLDDVVGDIDLLTSILTYHVIDGSVYASDLSDGLEAETINGATFTVNISDDGVTLVDGMSREVNIVTTDIEGTNGIIHVIDSVILPPMEAEMDSSDESMASETIADIVIAGSEGGNSDRDGFSYLLAAVQNADPSVLAALSGEGSLTVFAPTNQGFINLTAALGLTPKQLLSPQNEAVLTQVLLYHVVPSETWAADVVGLPDGSSVSTLLPDTQNAFAVYFDSTGTPYLNNGVNLVATDIEASNGVVHIINDVLVPQCIQQTLTGEGSCGN